MGLGVGGCGVYIVYAEQQDDHMEQRNWLSETTEDLRNLMSNTYIYIIY